MCTLPMRAASLVGANGNAMGQYERTIAFENTNARWNGSISIGSRVARRCSSDKRLLLWRARGVAHLNGSAWSRNSLTLASTCGSASSEGTCRPTTCAHVSGGGIKWLHEHRTEGTTDDAMDDAVEKNDFERLQFLISIGSPDCTGQGTFRVAYSESLEMLMWVHVHHPSLIDAEGYRQEFSDHLRLLALLDNMGL